MEQYTNKESNTDGGLNSATNLNHRGRARAVPLTLRGSRFVQGDSTYSVLLHISHGSERPTVGVSATRMNSVP
jgi:hypothetical protein